MDEFGQCLILQIYPSWYHGNESSSLLYKKVLDDIILPNLILLFVSVLSQVAKNYQSNLFSRGRRSRCRVNQEMALLNKELDNVIIPSYEEQNTWFLHMSATWCDNSQLWGAKYILSPPKCHFTQLLWDGQLYQLQIFSIESEFDGPKVLFLLCVFLTSKQLLPETSFQSQAQLPDLKPATRWRPKQRPWGLRGRCL